MKQHRQWVGASVFGAVAVILMLFQFPLIPGISYLKVDFSDLAILSSAVIYGPIAGLVSLLIRTLLHYIQTGGDMGYPIGDIASLVASLSLITPIYYFTLKSWTAKRFIIGAGIGTLTLTLVMAILNWLVLTPLYLALFHMNLGNLREVILLGVVPFNLAKGLVVSTAVYLVVGKLLPQLSRRRMEGQAHL